MTPEGGKCVCGNCRSNPCRCGELNPGIASDITFNETMTDYEIARQKAIVEFQRLIDELRPGDIIWIRI